MDNSIKEKEIAPKISVMTESYDITSETNNQDEIIAPSSNVPQSLEEKKTVVNPTHCGDKIEPYEIPRTTSPLKKDCEMNNWNSDEDSLLDEDSIHSCNEDIDINGHSTEIQPYSDKVKSTEMNKNEESTYDKNKGNIFLPSENDDCEIKDKNNMSENDASNNEIKTDENGRQLSAYEIKRLDRIRRNKAYLARLGLEEDKGNTTILSPFAQKMHDAKRRKKRERQRQQQKQQQQQQQQTPDNNSRRSSGRQRKSINYSELREAQTNTDKDGNGDTNNNSTRKKKKNSLPMFIFREFKRIERQKRLDVKDAQRNVKLAETELRYTKKKGREIEKKLIYMIRRKNLLKEMEQRRLLALDANQKKRDLMPYFSRLKALKPELCELNRILRHCINERQAREAVKEANEKMQIIDTIDHFPTYVLDARLQLDNLFLKSIPVTPSDQKQRNLILKNLKCKSEKLQITPTKPKSSKKEAIQVEIPSTTPSNAVDPLSVVDTPNTNKLSVPQVSPKLLPPMPSCLIQSSPFTPQQPPLPSPSTTKSEKKKKKFRARNVGGPVTREFGDSIQRKWLEHDLPTQPSSSSHFIPQVGDVVMYYPNIHHTFLQEHPDVRGVKSKSTYRTPLWKRANESKKGTKKENMLQQSNPSPKMPPKPWWTQEWISSIEESTSCYPIICRVENTVAEFPYDPLEETKKKKKRKSKHEQNQLDTNDATFPTPIHQRRTLKKNGPHIRLVVTLKPLTPVNPPELRNEELENKNDSFFLEEELSLPPMFSVLIFPSDEAQFLLPFTWAFGLELSLSKDDPFELNFEDGSNYTGTVLSTLLEFCGDHEQNYFDIFNMFLKRGNNVHYLKNLNDFISIQYEQRCKSTPMHLPEPDFRIALHMLLYNHQRRRYDSDIGVSGLQSSQDDSHARLASNPEEKRRATTFICDLSRFIRLMLPRWNGVTAIWNDSSQSLVSSWEINKCCKSEGMDKTGGEDSIASLVPVDIVNSFCMYKGDLIYNINDDLILTIEKNLKELMKEEDFSPFVRPVGEANAPGYSLFVPIGMCFRRILRRLKMHPSKVTYPYQPNDKSSKTSRCCYYRDIGSITCDINSIFHNCLFYNNPESDIVSLARDVTNRACKLVEKIHSNHINDRKQMLQHATNQAKKAQLVAKGMMTHDFLSETKQWDFTSLLHREPFRLPLNREWIESVVPDVTWDPYQQHPIHSMQLDPAKKKEAKDVPKDWLPQCGDMVLYNSQLHGKFVSEHFHSLTSKQRILPSILPLILNSQKTSKNLPNETFDERSKYWIIGTIISTRIVFPAGSNEVMNNKSTLAELSPLVAMELIFHYGQLQGKTFTVHWRPSKFSTFKTATPVIKSNNLTSASNIQESGDKTKPKIDTESNSCDYSFVRPAWIEPPLPLLPPHDISLALCNKPTGIPEATLTSIIKCFDVIKKRTQEGVEPDELQTSKCFGQLRKPVKGVYEPNDKQLTESDNDIFTSKNEVADSVALMHLSKSHFVPPWEFIEYKQKMAQKRAMRNKEQINKACTKSTLAEHDMLLPSPNLSLSLVYKRLQSGYYRQLSAVLSDIQEAYVSTITYLIRKGIGKNGVTLDSAFRIAKFCKENSTELEEEVKNFKRNQDDTLRVSLPDLSEMKFKQKIMKKDSNFEDCKLVKKEIMLLKKILAVRRLYATAIVCVQRTEKAEIVFGTADEKKKNTSWTKFCVNAHALEAEAKKIDEMLSYIRTDPCTFRKPIRRDKPYPTVKVRIKLNDFKAKDLADTDNASVKEKRTDHFGTNSLTRKSAIEMKTDNSNSEHLNKANTFKEATLDETTKISVTNVKMSGANILNPNFPPLHNNAVKENGTLNLKKYDVDFLHDHRVKENLMGGVKAKDQNTVSHYDINEPILLQPFHYEPYTSLCKVLFGRDKRQEACAQCRVNKLSFLKCRVRKAHSHPDISWLEELRKIGGADAMKNSLQMSLATNPEFAEYPFLKNYLRFYSCQNEPISIDQNFTKISSTEEPLMDNSNHKALVDRELSLSNHNENKPVSNVSEATSTKTNSLQIPNKATLSNGESILTGNETILSKSNVSNFVLTKDNLTKGPSESVSEAKSAIEISTKSLCEKAANNGDPLSSHNAIVLAIPNVSEAKLLGATSTKTNSLQIPNKATISNGESILTGSETILSKSNASYFALTKDNLTIGPSESVSEAKSAIETSTKSLCEKAANNGDPLSSHNAIVLAIPNVSEAKSAKETLEESKKDETRMACTNSVSNHLQYKSLEPVNLLNELESKPGIPTKAVVENVLTKNHSSAELKSIDEKITPEKINEPMEKNGQNLNNENTSVNQSSESEKASNSEEELRLQKETNLEFIRMAEVALEMANFLLKQAKFNLDKKPKLSDDFVSWSFPIDESDGKYMHCVICGLSGSMLCCETMKCPIVAHAHCVGLNQIPEGDWYCSKCSSNEKSGNKDNEIQTLENSVGSAKSAFTTETLIELLNTLKYQRVKETENEQSNGLNSTGDKPQINEEEKNEKKNLEKDLGNESNLDQDVCAELDKTVYAIGTRISKSFNNVNFLGKILVVPSPGFSYYRVRYEDGDEEDMSENELKNYIISNHTENSNLSTVPTVQDGRIKSEDLNHPPKRKRGRPRKHPIDKKISNKKAKLELRNAVNLPMETVDALSAKSLSDCPQTNVNTESKDENLSPSLGSADIILSGRRKRGRPRKTEGKKSFVITSHQSPIHRDSDLTVSGKKDVSTSSIISLDISKSDVEEDTADAEREIRHNVPRRSKRTLWPKSNNIKQENSEDYPEKRKVRRSSRLSQESSKNYVRSERNMLLQPTDSRQRTLLLDKYFDSKPERKEQCTGRLNEMFDLLY